MWYHIFMKKQVVVIHGGGTYDTYEKFLSYLNEAPLDFERMKRKGWKDNLPDDLGPEYEIIAPEMPNWQNAKYVEWKIWFDKLVPFLAAEVVMVGHSLGGIFLAKYLAENDLPKKIRAVFLVAAPFDDRGADYSLADFILPDSPEKLRDQAGKLSLYHSTDDAVVRFSDLEKYKKKLPGATFVIFSDRGHFSQGSFPEIVSAIKASFA